MSLVPVGSGRTSEKVHSLTKLYGLRSFDIVITQNCATFHKCSGSSTTSANGSSSLLSRSNIHIQSPEEAQPWDFSIGSSVPPEGFENVAGTQASAIKFLCAAFASSTSTMAHFQNLERDLASAPRGSNFWMCGFAASTSENETHLQSLDTITGPGNTQQTPYVRPCRFSIDKDDHGVPV